MSENIPDYNGEKGEEHEPEPPAWSQFADGAIAKVKALISKKRDARLAGELSPQEKLLAWQEEVMRAERLRNFLSSEFWLKDLEPLLRAESQLKPWVPGNPLRPEEVTTMFVHSSGRAYVLSRILGAFEQWSKKGTEAAARLQEETETRKKHDRIRKEGVRAGRI